MALKDVKTALAGVLLSSGLMFGGVGGDLDWDAINADAHYDYSEILANAPSEPEFDYTNFDYPGEVCFAFAQSDAPVRLIMGPFGSGKTSASIFEHVTRAIRMPFSVDGERKYKGLVVRDTYRNLYKTTIPSWWEWFPPDPKWGKWSGGQDRPAKHEIVFEDEYGVVRMEIDFAAVGDQNVEQFFKGYSVVGVQFEEVDGLPEDVIQYALGRCGRYPKKTTLRDPDVGFWRGVWGTLNAPDFDHWIYKTFVEEKDVPLTEDQLDYLEILREEFGYTGKRLMEFFKQPSGLSPAAENLQNLPAGYYQQLSTGKKWWVRRNVKNEFGYSRSGEPVYLEEFEDDRHFAPHKLTPIRGLPIQVGLDAGGHPAFVVRQVLPNGQKQYQREIANMGGGVGPKRFSDQILDLLARDYPGFVISEAWADPSCFYGGDLQTQGHEDGDVSFGQKVINLTGIKFKPAPSNEIAIRTDAVREALEGRIDGDVPEVLFCPSMKIARKGFNSKYAYAKDAKTDQLKSGNKPNKLPGFSDVQDCIQYVELGSAGMSVVTARQARRDIERQRRQSRRGGRKRPQKNYNAAGGGFSVFE